MSEKQDCPVNIYWTKTYLGRIDKVAKARAQRRNEWIKEAVREKLERDERALAKTGK
jgi:metal-responsive CopG/Arc/MetJ family transcriptional regulator